MSLSYEGIGASLQLVDDYVTVLNILPGGAAAVDGSLNANDRILAVGEGKGGKWVDVVGWRLDDVVQIIRGKVGTTVRLQILPAGAAPGSPEKELALVRSKVTLEAQAAQKEVRKVKRGDHVAIGVINVPSFYQDFEAKTSGAKDYRSTTRRAQAHRGAAEERSHRRADHGPARQRRRPPHRRPRRCRGCSSRAARSCSCARPAAASRCSTIPSRASRGTAR